MFNITGMDDVAATSFERGRRHFDPSRPHLVGHLAGHARPPVATACTRQGRAATLWRGAHRDQWPRRELESFRSVTTSFGNIDELQFGLETVHGPSSEGD